MSVGFPVTKADMDNLAGRLALALWQAFDDVRVFKLGLDDSIHNDAYLTALGYSGGDITSLRAAFTDLDKLRQISHAGAIQAATNDFWFNAKNLTGLSYTGA
jgi:hypothetical protein